MSFFSCTVFLLFAVKGSIAVHCSYWSSGQCLFSAQCQCYSDKSSCGYNMFLTELPLFNFYHNPISAMSVCGAFSAIYDNSFYLLENLTNSDICIEEYFSNPTTLITYKNTFITKNPNGIRSLNFYYYNPVNLSTMSNPDNIRSVLVQYSGIQTVPDWIDHFPSAVSINLDNNQIRVIENETFANLAISFNGN